MTPSTTRQNTPATGSDKVTIVDASGLREKQSQVGSSSYTERTQPTPPTEIDKASSPSSFQPAINTVLECGTDAFLESMKPTSKPSDQQGIKAGSETEAPPTGQHANTPNTTKLNAATTLPLAPNKQQSDPPLKTSNDLLPTSTIDSEESANLEAYILRPSAENCYDVIEWSYTTKPLPLQKKEIEAHMRKLGPTYSVIDSIGELLPEQMRLMLIKVKNRNGHLVSVQRTRDVDLATKMGTFKVQAVIFVVATSKPPETENPTGNIAVKDSGSTNSKTGGLFGNPHQNHSSGGFGSGNLSGPPAPQQKATFGRFGAPVAPGGGLFGSAHGLDEVQYVQKLKNDGEVCQYIERDYAGIQHFQSITFNPDYRAYSFEELRVRDQREGRVEPRVPSGQTAFGSGNVHSSQASEHAKGFGSNETNSNKIIGSVLFGGLANNVTIPNTLGEGRLFGNHPSTALGSEPQSRPPIFGNTSGISRGVGLFGGLSNHVATDDSDLYDGPRAGGLSRDIQTKLTAPGTGGFFGSLSETQPTRGIASTAGGLFGGTNSAFSRGSGISLGNTGPNLKEDGPPNTAAATGFFGNPPPAPSFAKTTPPIFTSPPSQNNTQKVSPSEAIRATPSFENPAPDAPSRPSLFGGSFVTTGQDNTQHRSRLFGRTQAAATSSTPNAITGGLFGGQDVQHATAVPGNSGGLFGSAAQTPHSRPGSLFSNLVSGQSTIPGPKPSAFSFGKPTTDSPSDEDICSTCSTTLVLHTSAEKKSGTCDFCNPSVTNPSCLVCSVKASALQKNTNIPPSEVGKPSHKLVGESLPHLPSKHKGTMASPKKVYTPSPTSRQNKANKRQSSGNDGGVMLSKAPKEQCGEHSGDVDPTAVTEMSSGDSQSHGNEDNEVKRKAWFAANEQLPKPESQLTKENS